MAVPRSLLRRMASPVALALVLSGAGLSLASAASAAAPATFSGRITGPLPAAGRGDVSLRAYDVRTGALTSVKTAGSSGRFNMQMPAGNYVIDAVSIRDRGVMSDVLVPVSLKSGQRRTGVQVRVQPARVKVAATARPVAPTAGVPADAGFTTYRFDDLAGATTALATLGRGLPALVAADIYGNESCSAFQVAGVRERAVLASTTRLRRSPYFARSGKVPQRLIAPQLAVTGTVGAGKDGAHAAFTIRIVDLATGATVDTLKGAVRRSGGGLFTDERRLAAALSERICRRPLSYRVALAIDARGEYAAYNSTARIATTAIARSTTPEPYSVWTGSSSFTWTDNVFRSRVTGCPASNIKPGTGGWSTSVTALPGAQVRVDLDLTLSEYTANSKADFVCTGGIASITGAPGPLLTGTAPRTFTLPATGGTGKIASTTTLAAGTGLIQSGSVTLTPAWGHALPGA